jgi:polygalacturonase
MKKIFTFCFGFLWMSTIHAQNYFNVLQYGAKNDSSELATKAIEKAITAATNRGGGTIYFPAGKYLTGPIHLKSNITILIDAGAELHFSDRFEDYLPMVESRYEGVDVYSFSPLFYAYKVENIAILGRGIIDGHGKKWWDFVESYKKDQPRIPVQYLFDSLNKNIILPDDPAQMKRGFLRPPFIQPMYCKNILIEGITIRNSPFWTINPEFCENVTVNAVTIKNPTSPNTDGINPESCKYVHISNCHISVGDDCITIKSGKDLPGRTKAMPAEDYTITNCTMLSGHGGVVIGSEVSGDVKKITISNCVFDGTLRGIRIKSSRGRGGVVEDIRVNNVVMKNILENAFVLDMQYSPSAPEPLSVRTTLFKDIHYSNITIENAKNAGIINGLEELPIENISFSDIQINAESGFVIQKAKNIAFHNVQVNTKKGASFKIADAESIELDNVKSLTPLAKIPVIQMNNVRQAFIHNCWPVLSTDIFMQVKGANSNGIFVKYNQFPENNHWIQKEVEVINPLILQ